MRLKELAGDAQIKVGDLLIEKSYEYKNVISIANYIGAEGVVFITLPPCVVGEFERYIKYSSEINYSTRLICVDDTENCEKYLMEYKNGLILK